MRLRTTAFLAYTVLLPGSLGLATSAEAAGLRRLETLEIGNKVYFFAEEGSGTIHDAAISAGPEGVKVRIRHDFWLDEAARVRSLSVLQMQARYRKDMPRQDPDYRVPLTGIMDRATLMIPYLRLHWRFETVRPYLRAGPRLFDLGGLLAEMKSLLAEVRTRPESRSFTRGPREVYPETFTPDTAAKIEEFARKVEAGLERAEPEMLRRRAECAFSGVEDTVELPEDDFYEPLALTLCLERWIVKAGEPLRLRYALHNVSRSIRVLSGGVLAGQGENFENLALRKGVHFRIIEPSGRDAAPVPRFRRGPPRVPAQEDSARTIVLEPGRGRRVPADPEAYLELDRFQLDCPGDYKIQARLDCLELPGIYCPGEGIRSRELSFRVLER